MVTLKESLKIQLFYFIKAIKSKKILRNFSLQPVGGNQGPVLRKLWESRAQYFTQTTSQYVFLLLPGLKNRLEMLFRLGPYRLSTFFLFSYLNQKKSPHKKLSLPRLQLVVTEATLYIWFLGQISYVPKSWTSTVASPIDLVLLYTYCTVVAIYEKHLYKRHLVRKLNAKCM